MQKWTRIASAAAGMLLIILMSGCNLMESNELAAESESLQLAKTAEALPADMDTISISENQKDDLIFLREEEKLARDVYLYLYDRWELPIFTRIARSEQQHMDAVGILLENYGIEDPAAETEAGEFQNDELAALWTELTEKGNTSEIEALKTGAIIEEYDIRDLAGDLETAETKDIEFVMNRLLRGSENHLRAFVRNLESFDENYTPQLLDDSTYTSIIEGNNENRRGRGGRRPGSGNRQRGPRNRPVPDTEETP